MDSEICFYVMGLSDKFIASRHSQSAATVIPNLPPPSFRACHYRHPELDSGSLFVREMLNQVQHDTVSFSMTSFRSA